ncbi:MAG: GAF domain-containing protein [bacterium]|nr:GAF domain-containing protein [bacterium]
MSRSSELLAGLTCQVFQGLEGSTDARPVQFDQQQLFASVALVPGLEAIVPEGPRPQVLPSQYRQLPSQQSLPEGPAVLVLDAELVLAGGAEWLRALPAAWVVLACPGKAEEQASEAGRRFLTLPGATPDLGWQDALRAAALHASGLAEMRRLEQLREQADRDLSELSAVGAALMQDRDPEHLLTRILAEARRVTTSDAGSLYLVEDGELHFRLTQNASIPGLEQPDLRLTIDASSFAGRAAASGEILCIDDAYALPADSPHRFDPRMDEATGYRTGAVLVVPMKSPRGDLVGVLQLINPAAGRYGSRDRQMAAALGGQAAVSIENGRLQAEIERLLDGFVRASVDALDQRDPGTSGHSVRVAELSCTFAGAVDRCSRGRLAAVSFGRESLRELRYAALLHDFGKVFVSEQVLGKDRKLPRPREVRVFGRIARAREALDARFHRERANYLLSSGHDGFDLFEKRLETEVAGERSRLDRFEQAIRSANEPRILPEEAPAELRRVAAYRFLGTGDGEQRLLDEDDMAFLGVARGSLTEEERLEIQSHVSYTHRFLAQIPWTRDLRGVEEIAWGHHEKLDGSGYPRRLEADAIPIPTRLLTIVDIFDALTAADRPYKKALPLEKALDVLQDEASRGRIDSDLLAIFLEGRIWSA